LAGNGCGVAVDCSSFAIVELLLGGSRVYSRLVGG
jgi:hypothetical protein